MNIQQFKRPWKDYNFRYLYKDLKGGRRIKDDGIFRRKIFGPLPEARWKAFGKFRTLQKFFTVIYKRFSANRKQFTWYLKLLIGQLGRLWNER